MAAKKQTTMVPAREVARKRGSRGKTRVGAFFPVSPLHAGLPRDYAGTLREIKQRIQSGRAIVQEVLARIPWYHHIALMEKCRTRTERLWYARQSAEKGWSHNILSLQIESRAHVRQGKALTNFKATLPPADSDMAAQVFKGPYLFDFLGTADPRREQIERSRMPGNRSKLDFPDSMFVNGAK